MKRIFNIPILFFCFSVLAFGQFKPASLKMKYNALEPYIDSATMYIHYNLHYVTYINNLNKSLEKYPELYNRDITDLLKNIKKLPAEVQISVRDNGGGYYNHTLFWRFLAPEGTTSIQKNSSKALIENFGSVEAFKDAFEKAALSRFGSGWAWLIKDNTGKLRIESTANQENPIMQESGKNSTIILTLDVWEHAYYLKYQNKRASYAKAFWNVVNWNEVETQLSK